VPKTRARTAHATRHAFHRAPVKVATRGHHSEVGPRSIKQSGARQSRPDPSRLRHSTGVLGYGLVDTIYYKQVFSALFRICKAWVLGLYPLQEHGLIPILTLSADARNPQDRDSKTAHLDTRSNSRADQLTRSIRPTVGHRPRAHVVASA